MSLITLTETFDSTCQFPTTGSWYVVGGYYRNNAIGASTSTTSTITITIPTGAVNPMVSWDYYVSSEAGCDYHTGLLNGTQLYRIAGVPVSGKVTNQALVVGTNTITLTYNKDGSVNGGSDMGSIDNLVVTYEMPSKLKAKISGIWKDCDGRVKINGAWKTIDKIYTKVNGVWKSS